MNPFLDRLRARFPEGADAVLVSELVNVQWLTGFTGSAGRVIVTRDTAAFVTDSRYTLQAAEQVRGMDARSFKAPVEESEFLAATLKELGVRRLAFDPNAVTVGQLEKWRGKTDEVEWIPSAKTFDNLRGVKTEEEIETIRRACGLTDATFAHVKRLLQVGVTERDVALEIEFFIRRSGASLAFSPIVVSGERSARPHGVPSDKPFASGDFVTLDFGAALDGYSADLTRTVVIGEATPRHEEVYATVLAANQRAIAELRPGMTGKQADALARSLIAERGYGDYFGHGLGHALGRLVHDGGRLSTASEDLIEVGQVWTIEPGVYVPGFGGVRVEDDVVVREGRNEVLTSTPKDLLVLG